MPDPEHIRSAMQDYLKRLSAGDTEGIMALYADDATVEDPVGGEPIVGREAVRAFYAAAAGKLSVELTGPIRVAGVECAVPMLAEVDLGGAKRFMDVIDVMRFDEDGKVVSMRAFWSPADMRETR